MDKNRFELAIMNFDVDTARQILEEELNSRPLDIDLLIKLCLVELTSPDEDFYKSLEYIEKIKGIDSENINALIIECNIHYIYLGGIDGKLFNKLASIKINNNSIMSILRYLMSFHYEYTDMEKQINLLEESIRLCDKYVYNYKALGNIFIGKGNLIRGKNLIRKSLENIELVYDDKTIVDFTDFSEYVDEYITGTHITGINKEAIEELL